jgi:uncharacterized cupredoxin-like copper-binding protein
VARFAARSRPDATAAIVSFLFGERAARRGPLIALLALHCGAGVCATAAADGSAPRDVRVVLSDYRFTPDHLVFERGVLYRLILENRGKELHEFTAAAFLHAVTLKTPEILASGGNEVVLQPGEHKTIEFSSSASGRYALSCADHDWAGMIGEIVIR